jgi:hypothetical protein
MIISLPSVHRNFKPTAPPRPKVNFHAIIMKNQINESNLIQNYFIGAILTHIEIKNIEILLDLTFSHFLLAYQEYSKIFDRSHNPPNK